MAKTIKGTIPGTKLEQGKPLPGYYFPTRTYRKQYLQPEASVRMPQDRLNEDAGWFFDSFRAMISERVNQLMEYLITPDTGLGLGHANAPANRRLLFTDAQGRDWYTIDNGVDSYEFWLK